MTLVRLKVFFHKIENGAFWIIKILLATLTFISALLSKGIETTLKGAFSVSLNFKNIFT